MNGCHSCIQHIVNTVNGCGDVKDGGSHVVEVVGYNVNKMDFLV